LVVDRKKLCELEAVIVVAKYASVLVRRGEAWRAAYARLVQYRQMVAATKSMPRLSAHYKPRRRAGR
jgi:hypothetical protein